MIFDPGTVFLRRICLGQTEVLRAAYAAVRDRNWATVPPRLEAFSSEAGPDSFHLIFRVICRQGDIDFRWHGDIRGEREGAVIYSFDGQAHSTFLRNRIGFCVLHPLAGCAGHPCEVEHVDGSREQGVFPEAVAPSQPFRQMRAIRHRIGRDLLAEVRLEGEVFEMEDQRNWTDASFKTYCTPLELPFPSRIERGTRIRQTVSLRLISTSPGRRTFPSRLTPSPRTSASGTVLVLPAKPVVPLPPIGLGLSGQGRPLTADELSRLKLLRLSHLRADLDLAGGTWRKILRRATQEARQLDCSLHLALFLTNKAETELDALVGELQRLRPPVSLWLVFHVNEPATRERWVRLAKDTLRRFNPQVPLAAGTNANFAEINRCRPDPDTVALPCFSITPQVHAFDDLSLMENLEAQGHVIKTAARFASGPVVVSPVTLKPRFNPVATGKDAPRDPRALPVQVDARQGSLLAAAWTLGSIAALTATGCVHSLTYYETTGWRGVMEAEAGSPLPEKFPSVPGAVFPLFQVLAALAGFRKAAPIKVDAPQTLAALALFDGRRRRVLVANLTGESRKVTLRPAARLRSLRVLDENALEKALMEPERFPIRSSRAPSSRSTAITLRLNPYAFASLDLA
jgi:D-apionolactonase